ncbi:MAG: type II toxin-antitoxin system ParD family antitoxin [Pleurocapsa sp. SU_196_0]|nr:type II toxin-antitoxin system ParD family antitoxin [Pleurocapsa sp. SU_196_0]
MNVSLTPELEAWVESRVQSGLYQSASEVIREALRLLHKTQMSSEQQLETLRAALQRGLEDVEAGRLREDHPQLLETVRQKVRSRRA